MLYPPGMGLEEPAAVELSRGPRWLLAMAVAVLTYFAAWMLYVFGSLVWFTLFKTQLPSWGTWPVRIGQVRSRLPLPPS